MNFTQVSYYVRTWKWWIFMRDFSFILQFTSPLLKLVSKYAKYTFEGSIMEIKMFMDEVVGLLAVDSQ